MRVVLPEQCKYQTNRAAAAAGRIFAAAEITGEGRRRRRERKGEEEMVVRESTIVRERGRDEESIRHASASTPFAKQHAARDISNVVAAFATPRMYFLHGRGARARAYEQLYVHRTAFTVDDGQIQACPGFPRIRRTSP